VLISIIIPSYFSRSTIEDCIQSLLSQDTKESFDIWVINSSPDDISDSTALQFPEVHLIQLPQRVFAGKARNIGVQKAKGNILAFIDADCIVSSDWIDTIISWHQRGYKAVGGSIINESRDNIFSKAEYPLEILEFSPNNPRAEVKFVSAANSSFSRDVFNQYGFFPDIRAGEDVIFCHNLIEKGEKIIFDPDLKVFHKNDIGFQEYLKKQFMHGQYSYKIRAMAKLSGSFLNHPLLLPLFIPVMPFLRVLRIIYRSFCLRNKLIYDILSTFPLFFMGCFMWGLGYTKGYIESR
jgi:glycosyltransferase involved in cell wall biosynthesis